MKGTSWPRGKRKRGFPRDIYYALQVLTSRQRKRERLNGYTTGHLRTGVLRAVISSSSYVSNYHMHVHTHPLPPLITNIDDLLTSFDSGTAYQKIHF